MTFRTELEVRRRGAAQWTLLADLVYEGETDRFTVPAGFVTDYATVPDFLVWLMNKTGPYTLAAVVHDWLLISEVPAHRVTSRDADGIFRRIMREEGVTLPKRWLMWSAVRLAALFSARRAYGRDFYKDAPLVLLIAALFLLSVLPPLAALLVLITRALLRPLRVI